MKINLIKTWDGITETKEVVKIDHDYIEALKDIYAPEDLDIDTKDIQELIEIETTTGRVGTLANYSLDEIKDIVTELYINFGYNRKEAIEGFYIAIKPDYKEYEDTDELINKEIENIKDGLYQMI